MRNTQMDRLLLNIFRFKCVSLQHAHIWSHLQYSCAISHPLWKFFECLLCVYFCLRNVNIARDFAVTAVTPRTASADYEKKKTI